jgi:hypothetical protein
LQAQPCRGLLTCTFEIVSVGPHHSSLLLIVILLAARHNTAAFYADMDGNDGMVDYLKSKGALYDN